MIFSFDLDGTLLFSQRRLAPEPAVIPVEWRQEEPFGFMTLGALEALRAIQGRAVCMVNTLRGLEQARRVDFVRDGSCPYIAVQNGLYLYRDGQLDELWAHRVATLVHELPLALPEGIARILAVLPGIETLSKQYEYLAVFFVNEAFDDEVCAQLAGELAAQGWALVRQRRKLYLYPAGIHKGVVLERVRELEGGAEALGFGDSCFDLPFLRRCAAAWIPGGCELDEEGSREGLSVSSALLQGGTEEALLEILERFTTGEPV